jgi:uncharacterized Zn-binding protein involved in type VI secretion
VNPQARVGDKSKISADSHGCPSCPHVCTGPGTEGSLDVLVNDQPTMRTGDAGTHSGCCGANSWTAKDGAAGVFINSLKAYRKGDPAKHCGGNGVQIDGSPDVLVGDLGGSEQAADSAGPIVIRLVSPFGDPIPDLPVTVFADGEQQDLISDRDGYIRISDIRSGVASVKFHHRFGISRVTKAQ